jgi:hypothetical protein
MSPAFFGGMFVAKNSMQAYNTIQYNTPHIKKKLFKIIFLFVFNNGSCS